MSETAAPAGEFFIWKFLIPENKWVKDAEDGARTWSGYLAVAVARDEQMARILVAEWANRNGFDSRWLRVAEVRQVPIAEAFIAWAQS